MPKYTKNNNLSEFIKYEFYLKNGTQTMQNYTILIFVFKLVIYLNSLICLEANLYPTYIAVQPLSKKMQMQQASKP